MSNTSSLLRTAGDIYSEPLIIEGSQPRVVLELLLGEPALVSRLQTQTLHIQRGSLIEAEIRRCQTRLRLIDASCQHAPGPGGDLADRADAVCQQARQMAARVAYEAQLRQARHALQRSLAGEGGVCEQCGVHIDPARLDAIPTATLCLECKRMRETAHL